MGKGRQAQGPRRGRRARVTAELPPFFQSIQSVYTSNTTQFSRWFLFFSLNQSLPQLSTKLTIAISVVVLTTDIDTNNDYYQTSNQFPGELCRIGVWNADGVDPPVLLESMLSGSLPRSLASEIEMLLAKGKNPTNADPGFIDSILASNQVVPLIVDARDRSALHHEEVKLTEGLTVLRMTFSGAAYADGHSANLEIEVSQPDTIHFLRLSAFKSGASLQYIFTRTRSSHQRTHKVSDAQRSLFFLPRPFPSTR